MTVAKLGVGIEFRRGDGASPEQFTKIDEVRTVPEVGQRNDLVEVTNLDSVSGKEYIYGLGDGKEIPLAVNFNPSDQQHTGLRTDQANKVTRNFQLYFPTVVGGSPDAGLLVSFAALVLDTSFSGGPNEAQTMSATLKITGAVTEDTLP